MVHMPLLSKTHFNLSLYFKDFSLKYMHLSHLSRVLHVYQFLSLCFLNSQHIYISLDTNLRLSKQWQASHDITQYSDRIILVIKQLNAQIIL